MLYIAPPDGTPGVTPQTVIQALSKVGIRCTEEPDDHGHWLVLDGFESPVNLSIKDGVATYSGFRFAMEDDPAVVEKVAEPAFKSIGWQVSDDEGFLWDHCRRRCSEREPADSLRDEFNAIGGSLCVRHVAAYRGTRYE